MAGGAEEGSEMDFAVQERVFLLQKRYIQVLEARLRELEEWEACTSIPWGGEQLGGLNLAWLERVLPLQKRYIQILKTRVRELKEQKACTSIPWKWSGENPKGLWQYNLQVPAPKVLEDGSALDSIQESESNEDGEEMLEKARAAPPNEKQHLEMQNIAYGSLCGKDRSTFYQRDILANVTECEEGRLADQKFNLAPGK